MSDEPVSGLPDPKYAGVSDSDGIRGMEDRLRAIAAGPFHEHYRVTVRQATDALRTALAQLDEARAERDAIRETGYKTKTAMHQEFVEERRLRKAAEARLEELTRERDEAKALVAANWCGNYWRGVNHDQADEIRAFLHLGGSE